MDVNEREHLSWSVRRTADLDAIERANGRVVWRVLVSDSGREPFLRRWFNDPSSARDFIARLESDGRSASPPTGNPLEVGP